MIETRVELAVRASYSREMKFKRAVQAIIDRGEHPSVVRYEPSWDVQSPRG